MKSPKKLFLCSIFYWKLESLILLFLRFWLEHIFMNLHMRFWFMKILFKHGIINYLIFSLRSQYRGNIVFWSIMFFSTFNNISIGNSPYCFCYFSWLPLVLFGAKLFVVFYNTVLCQQKQVVLWKNNKSIKYPVLSI